MTLIPFLSAAPHIQVHVIAAMLALILGPVALYRTRRDTVHKVIGYVWMLAVLVTAISSFAITNFGVIGPVSPIHALSVLALWSLWRGVTTIRAGHIAAHRSTLRNLYWRGLMIAGLFNFLPSGRMVNRIVFPDTPQYGWWVIGLGLGAILVHAIWDQRQQSNDSLHPQSERNAGASAAG